jgi:hypothetical protein
MSRTPRRDAAAPREIGRPGAGGQDLADRADFGFSHGALPKRYPIKMNEAMASIKLSRSLRQWSAEGEK